MDHVRAREQNGKGDKDFLPTEPIMKLKLCWLSDPVQQNQVPPPISMDTLPAPTPTEKVHEPVLSKYHDHMQVIHPQPASVEVTSQAASKAPALRRSTRPDHPSDHKGRKCGS